MALKWLEGFDAYSGSVGDSVDSMAVMYQQAAVGGANNTAQAPRVAGSGFSWRSLSEFSFVNTRNLVKGPSTWISGVGVKKTLAQSADQKVITFLTGIVSKHEMSVALGPNNTVAIYFGGFDPPALGDLGTLVKRSADNVFALDQWFYLEAKFFFTIASAGTGEVRINGNTVLTLTVADLQQTLTDHPPSGRFKVDRVQLRHAPGPSFLGFSFLDDWYICDDTGAQNNDFIGNTQVQTGFPVGDGFQSEFTPGGGGANFDKVNESDADDDTSFVESTAAAQADLYQYNISANNSTVHGIMISTRTRMTDASQVKLNHRIKSGGTNLDTGTPNRHLSATYQRHHTVHELDPNTGLPWTTAGLQAAEFGFTRVV